MEEQLARSEKLRKYSVAMLERIEKQMSYVNAIVSERSMVEEVKMVELYDEENEK